MVNFKALLEHKKALCIVCKKEKPCIFYSAVDGYEYPVCDNCEIPVELLS